MLSRPSATAALATAGRAAGRGETGVPAVPELGHGERAPFLLPPLPYAARSLGPVISTRTVQFHYRRHHAGYLATLNRLLAGQPLAGEPLIAIIRQSHGGTEPGRLFNSAAQLWNHSFYWRCLTPGGGAPPGGRLAAAIGRDFGGFPALRDRLITTATGQFGSGWAWLCAEDGRLSVRRTANADTPVRHPGLTPLLTIDVWEHAYYLDYQNRRTEHVAQLIDRLLNWRFAAAIFEAHLERLGSEPAAPAPARPEVAALPAAAAPLRAAAPAVPALAVRPADSRAAAFSRLARGR
ncbi:MAG: superoxide dismutase [Rhodospirillaceae bacterium]